METGTESNIRASLPLHGGRIYSFLVLFFLLAIAFFPLIAGKNFIPFERYPLWISMLAQSSGQKFQIESPAFRRLKAMPWAEDPEVGSIGVTWAENLYFAHRLKRGQLPLWNPYAGGGVPTLDSGQSRPFNPFRLPFYFFPGSWMYSLTLLAGLIFGGIGAYLWLSRCGFSNAAVTLGTGLFVFNPWVLDRLVLTDSAAYFILPWCLITLSQMVWRNWPSIARAVLCFVLMGHSGHPEVAMIVAGVAVAVYLTGRNPCNGDAPFVLKLKTIALVAAITLVCLAILWLPVLRLLAVGFTYKKHAWFVYEYGWKSFLALPSDVFIAPGVGAILGCTFLAWKRVPKIWAVLLAGAIVFLFPLPWFGTRLSSLLSYLGLPPLYLKGVLWASISFLVPYGLELFVTCPKRSITIVGSAIGGALFTVSGLQFISFPMAREDISALPVRAFLLIALGVLVLVVFRATRAKLPALVVSAVLLAPLVHPLSLNKLLWNRIDFRTNSVIEWMRTHRPHERSVSVDPGLSFPIPPNLGQVYGVKCAEISAVIFLNNYWAMFHHPRALPTAVFFDFLSQDVFSQMGASVVLLPNEAYASGLNLLIKGTQFSAYSIPGAHGRLYFAERACQYKPGTDFPSQILSLNQETDAVAVVEGMGSPVPAVIPEIPQGKGKTVFERDDIADVLVHTECPSEGLLVLRDSWYPDWLAFVDGKRAPILRINGCFRGVIVPAGAHSARFVYRPLLVYIAGAVSLAATLLVTLVCVQKHLIRTVRRFCNKRGIRKAS